jgi:eukaryotic-like serine/threonine-protein kinase
MLLEGKQLSHYQLQRCIGAGDTGEVYLALDRLTNRQCTIKVIRTDASIARTGAFIRATSIAQQERKTVETLNNSHILPVTDLGQIDVDGQRLTCAVMPYAREVSLTDWWKKRNGIPLTIHVVAHFVDQGAHALHAMHSQQIIHQDIKPSNLILRSYKSGQDRPELLVTDFWVASFTAAIANLPNAIRNLPAYASPEQWRQQPVPATDQYALAVVAYELLTGHLPFKGSSSDDVMHAHFNTQPLAPSSVNAQIPSELDGVLLRALAKNPTGRYQSILEFSQAFRHVAALHSSGTAALSRRNATIFLYCILIGILSLVVGSILNAVGALPSIIANISGSLGATLAIVSGIWGAVLERAIPRGIWQNAYRPLVVLLASILTVGLLALAPVEYSIQNAQHLAVIATATASVQAANATATVKTQAANATATAQIQATVTDALDPYPPFNGILALDDTLVDANHGQNWYQGRTIGDCKFESGAYHVVVQGHIGFIQGCTQPVSDFSNFAYEIQVQILQGDIGGMLFRADFQKTQAYEFIIDTNGCYQFIVIGGPSSGKSLIAQCNKEAIGTGSSTNLLAVVADGSTFRLYANRQLLATVKDSTYSHGSIGVGAINLSIQTDAAFNYAKVWKMF